MAVVGTGLMGTSVAMAAARSGARVRGFDADAAVLEQAARRSGMEPAGDLAGCVGDAEVVVVCTPVPAIAAAACAVLEAAPSAVVTDVGSVKSRVLVEVEARSAAPGRFVGGHPMGGSERSGPEHASPSVLDGIAWVLTPGARSEPAATELLREWVASLGAEPVVMEPARHDRLVAFVSHLPQVASTALMALAAEEEADEPEILLLAAGGFRDLTRLAASSPTLWGDILLANREALERAIDLYVERLRRLQDLVRRGRRAEVEEALARAKRARLALAAKPQVRSGVAVIQVSIPDRPGVLARLTAGVGEAGVNIEDLQIVHSPEGGRGTVHLTVAAGAADLTARVLADRGFDPVRLA